MCSGKRAHERRVTKEKKNKNFHNKFRTLACFLLLACCLPPPYSLSPSRRPSNCSPRSLSFGRLVRATHCPERARLHSRAGRSLARSFGQSWTGEQERGGRRAALSCRRLPELCAMRAQLRAAPELGRRCASLACARRPAALAGTTTRLQRASRPLQYKLAAFS